MHSDDDLIFSEVLINNSINNSNLIGSSAAHVCDAIFYLAVNEIATGKDFNL